MAQTKKKRRTKHRGTQAGNVESRGRTGRPTSRAQARQQAIQRRQGNRAAAANKEPSWRGATIRAAFAAAVFLAVLIVLGQPPAGAIFISIVMFGMYIVLGYYSDQFLYKRRMKKEAEAAAARKAAKQK